MRTEKQIESSRLNGAKSNGPVTVEGKLASSQNALKHGMHAKIFLLKDEIPAAYDAIATELFEEFHPASPFEESLLRSMAMARFKHERYSIIERKNLELQMEIEDERLQYKGSDAELLATHGFRSLAGETRTLDLLLRYLSSLDRQYLRAHKRFIEVRNARLKSGPDQPPPNPHVIAIDSAKRTQLDRDVTAISTEPAATVAQTDSFSTKRTQGARPRFSVFNVPRTGLELALARARRLNRSQRRKISSNPLAPAA